MPGGRIGRPLSEEWRGAYGCRPKLVILSAGAVNSAVLLLRSANGRPEGLANSSGQVGRNFMNHNCSAVIGVNPFRSIAMTAFTRRHDAFNDYYLSVAGMAAARQCPAARQDQRRHSQGLDAPSAPRFGCLSALPATPIDFYDERGCPNPESRVMVDGEASSCNGIAPTWRRPSGLEAKMRAHTRRHRLSDRAQPSV
jgi:hypothetical protein